MGVASQIGCGTRQEVAHSRPQRDFWGATRAALLLKREAFPKLYCAGGLWHGVRPCKDSKTIATIIYA
jgi:hypothetical protein